MRVLKDSITVVKTAENYQTHYEQNNQQAHYACKLNILSISFLLSFL